MIDELRAKATFPLETSIVPRLNCKPVSPFSPKMTVTVVIVLSSR